MSVHKLEFIKRKVKSGAMALLSQSVRTKVLLNHKQLDLYIPMLPNTLTILFHGVLPV